MRVLAVLAIALFYSRPALADSLFQWNNIKGGDFADGTNWVGGVAPGANDTAVFAWNPDLNSAQPITVNVPNVYGLSNLDVQSGQYTFNGTYAGATSIVVGDTVQATGQPVTAVLNVTGLGTKSYTPQSPLTLGTVPGSSGIINFTGGFGGFPGHASIGTAGTGVLNVLGGSIVYGGTFYDPGSMTIGSAGTVTVSGSGSVLDYRSSGSISGPGTVNVLNAGSLLVSNMLNIGHLLIDGPGSLAYVMDSNFSGGVTISNGGSFTTLYQDMVRMTVTGPGSSFVAQFGGNVLGLITVADGGYVRDTDACGGGVVTGSGSRWVNSGTLTVTTTLSVADGGTVQSTGLRGVVVESSGAVNGNGGTLDALVVNGGALHGGDSGTITITGDYTQTMPGILTEQIAGFSEGDYDKTVINGTASCIQERTRIKECRAERARSRPCGQAGSRFYSRGEAAQMVLQHGQLSGARPERVRKPNRPTKAGVSQCARRRQWRASLHSGPVAQPLPARI
jgi:fibronectin-binding autotransporter adhesin